MPWNAIDLLPYIVDRLQKKNIRHEVQMFESGSVMVDVWIEDKFYVIQINGNSIGLSLNTEETLPFDIIPDQEFYDPDSFKDEFRKIF